MEELGEFRDFEEAHSEQRLNGSDSEGGEGHETL